MFPLTSVHFRALTLGLLALLLVLALVPPQAAPQVTGWDKANHALAFLVLGGLASLGWRSRWRWPLLLGYGLLIEGLQALTPWREPSALDVLANTLGLFAAWGLLRLRARA